MEYKKIAELKRAGAATPALPLTRAERLERWAAALEQRGSERLDTLVRTEHIVRHELSGLRADGSPLAVAFADTVLRVDGLRDDTYGEAKRYFALSDHELHWIICSCNFGGSVRAETVAYRVRAILTRPAEPVGRWLQRMFFGRAA